MKEIEVHAWCDWVHPDRTPAVSEVRVALNGGTAHLLDLCADHEMLLSAVFDRGSSVTDQPDPEVAKRTCPECGLVSATRTAMGQHLRKIHQKGIKDYANA